MNPFPSSVDRKKSFLSAGEKKISFCQTDRMTMRPLSGQGRQILVIEATNGDLNWLTAWSKAERAFLQDKVLEHGGILFRGFEVSTVEKFQQFASDLHGPLIRDCDRSAIHTNRVKLSETIFNASEYSSSQEIELHNEYSYASEWPMRISLCCLSAAPAGGESIIADNRAIADYVGHEILAQFIARGVSYVRRFGPQYGLRWQQAFETEDPAAVDAYCKVNKIDVEWSGSEELCTRQVRQAVAAHPRTNEPLWFNQAHLFHISSLDSASQQSMRSVFDPDRLPRDARYGDGQQIDDAVFDQVRAAYRRATITIGLRAGDVLALDNMLMAHGRRPFSGERRVIVAMGDLHRAS